MNDGQIAQLPKFNQLAVDISEVTDQQPALHGNHVSRMQVKADAELVVHGVIYGLKNGFSVIRYLQHVGRFSDWHNQSRQNFAAVTIDGSPCPGSDKYPCRGQTSRVTDSRQDHFLVVRPDGQGARKDFIHPLFNDRLVIVHTTDLDRRARDFVHYAKRAVSQQFVFRKRPANARGSLRMAIQSTGGSGMESSFVENVAIMSFFFSVHAVFISRFQPIVSGRFRFQ